MNYERSNSRSSDMMEKQRNRHPKAEAEEEPTRKSCKRRWWGGSVSTGASAAAGLSRLGESGLAQLSPRGGLLRRRQRTSKERTGSRAERAETELVALVSSSGSGSGPGRACGQFSPFGVGGRLRGHPPAASSSGPPPSPPSSSSFHLKCPSQQAPPITVPTPIRRPVARRLTFDSLADVCVEPPRHGIASLPTHSFTPPSSRSLVTVPFKHNSWEGLPLDLKVVCLSYLGQQGWTKNAHLSHSARQASDRYSYYSTVVYSTV